MGETATMDEAANTALLLEQHIQDKMARALADFMFGDAIGASIQINKALDAGNLPHASVVVRQELMMQLVHSDVFKNNLAYMVKNIVRDEMASLQTMVREEFARGILRNTHTSNRTG